MASRNFEGLSSNTVSDEFAAGAIGARARTRLLMVNSTLHIGGAEQVAATLSGLIDRTGFDVGRVTSRNPASSPTRCCARA